MHILEDTHRGENLPWENAHQTHPRTLCEDLGAEETFKRCNSESHEYVRKTSGFFETVGDPKKIWRATLTSLGSQFGKVIG